MSIILVFLCALLAYPFANAVDPDRRISQYAHSAWRVRDGAFAGAPSSIAQTADGYIWIGTHSGLVRFDGVRFVSWTPPAGKHLPGPAVISLLGAKDGSLWIGTDIGLAQWKNGELTAFPQTTGRVNSIYEDRDGTIWIARSRTQAGGICKVAASVVKCYGSKDEVPPYAETLVADNFGYVWIDGGTALLRWKPGSLTSFPLRGIKAKGIRGITALALAPDGSVWTGIADSGRGLGLQQLVNGAWKSLVTPAFDSSTLNVYGLGLDRHNALWIASEGAGIYRVYNGKVDRFRSADGLTSDTAENFFEDREGNLWVTTREGVDCFRDLPVVTFSTHEGLSGDHVESVLAAKDGTIWLGNSPGLDYVRGGIVSSIRKENGLPGKRVTSLFQDHTGRLWVGLDNGLFLYEHGKFKSIQRPDGGPIGIVVGMIEDAGGDIWAAVFKDNAPKVIQIRDGKFAAEASDTRLSVGLSLAADPHSGFWFGVRKGALGRYQNGNVQVFPLQDASTIVSQVLANPDGSLLAATSDGLVELRSGTPHTLSHQNGLPCDRIYAVIADSHSNLWLYAECGLISIKSGDLQHWRENPDAKVAVDLLDAYDGAQPYLPVFTPAATRSSDGRLWLANESVIQMIDPDRLYHNAIPPPVHIEGVIADRKSYSSQSGLRLPARTRDLEIDYTALSFVLPQKVRFRYKLEGYDRDWQEPQTRRQAFYSNLGPGNYRFRVMACNNSGVWNEAGATLDFNIAPAYYQRLWFRLSCVFVLLVLLAGLYRLRVRQLAGKFNLRLEERVNERTRIARDLHDTLLQSFQGLILKFRTLTLLLLDGPAETRNMLEEMIEQGRAAITEGRDAVHGLRSSTVTTNDLPHAISTIGEQLHADQATRQSPDFRVRVEGTPREIVPVLRDDIYRIAGEALRNAFLQAHATHIEVEIRYDERQFRLRVRDDGKGMEPRVLAGNGRPGHYGLPGMYERAELTGGKLEVWSELDTGTEIELTIPASLAYTESQVKRHFIFRKKGT
jgi:signal transduction histidine kinase/ligand-binding sensor domain-containing protein